jgi:hypothetical protein
VKYTDPAAYELRVAGATDRLDDFYIQLVGELDQQNGGFRWWSGFSDWKTLTMLSDYLIQSVQGTSQALMSASLAADNHRQVAAEEDVALTAVMGSGAKNHHEIAAAIPQDAQARRRGRTITETAEACLFHLGQTLDRLTAAVLIVGGFEYKDVATAYWTNVIEVAEWLANGSTKVMFEPIGSNGRSVQEALVAPVLDWHKHGPDEWMLWMRDARHGTTHRSPAKTLNVAAGNRFARPFYRQPRWSEIQALVFGSKPPNQPVFDTFILKPTEDVLEGLCESTAKYVEEITDSMVTCWTARKSNPPMIVQHGRQWRSVEPEEDLSTFPGYGDDLVLTARQLMMHPLEAGRWTAARVLDERRRDWY